MDAVNELREWIKLLEEREKVLLERVTALEFETSDLKDRLSAVKNILLPLTDRSFGRA